MHDPEFDLIVIGAGPAGLACAIEARRCGLRTVVLEQGSVVDAIRRFPQNMIWFSTPELLSLGGIPFVLSTVRPTRVDTLNYYQMVVKHFELDVRSHDGVVAVTRQPGAFEVLTRGDKRYRGSNVIVATGYFDHPNRLGIEGEDQEHVLHYYDEPYRYFGRKVVVVGGRNSAVEAALDLYRHGAHVTLVHRGPSLSEGVKYWILPDIENRIKSGGIQAFFSSAVREIRPGIVHVQTPGGERELVADFIFILIGFLPDSARLRSFGIELDEDTLAPRCRRDSYETTIPGLYVAGSVVAGRNTNKVFVENGRMHGSQIIADILKKKLPKS